jgi:hypothetical protein
VTSERAPFYGDARRERPIFEAKSLGSWSGRVRVVPIDPGGGTVHFEISAEWRGPGLQFPGEPEPAGPVDASDTYLVGRPELARAIALAAADELRADRQPVLVELAARLRREMPEPGKNGAL